MNNPTASDITHDNQPEDIHLYARVFPDLEQAIGRPALTAVADTRKIGVLSATTIRAIEIAGSMDLNIALLIPNGNGALVLDGFLAGLANHIATDMMLVYVARHFPKFAHINTMEIEQSCKERITALVSFVANSGKLPSRPTNDEAKGGWCIVEMMGKKRLSAWVTKAQFGGMTTMKLEIPTNKDKPQERATKYVGSSKAIYAITPCDEHVALGIAHMNDPTPVDSWELDDGPIVTATPSAALQLEPRSRLDENEAPPDSYGSEEHPNEIEF